MTTPNTILTPTQRVVQDWENHFDPDYSINGFCKDYVVQLAIELEAAQIELDAIRKIILDHIGYATVTQNTIKEIITENAELKKDNTLLSSVAWLGDLSQSRRLLVQKAIDAARKEQG